MKKGILIIILAFITSAVVSQPVCNVTASDTVGCVPMTICFGSSSSGVSVNCIWYFYDGSLPVSTVCGNNVCHTFTLPGVFNVKLIVTDGINRSDTCYQTITLSSYGPIDPPILTCNLTPSDTICFGDTAIFTAIPDTFDSYTFFNNGSAQQTSSNNTWWSAQLRPGNLIRVIGFKNCTSGYSNSVSVHAYPETKVIVNKQADSIYSNKPFNSYQWFYEDSMLVGDTLSFHLCRSTGYYHLEVVDSNGCIARSARIYFGNFPTDIFGAAPSVATTTIKLSPNPATTSLSIQTTNFQPQTLSIFDMSGRKVMEEKYSPQIDISALQPGGYFMELKNKETVVRKRWVKIN